MFLLLNVCALVFHMQTNFFSAETFVSVPLNIMGLNSIRWLKAADYVVQAVIACCDVLINGFINWTADCDLEQLITANKGEL